MVAVLLGAMTIHGIQSGPLFISQNTTLAYGIFAAYLIAHPLMVKTGFPLAPFILGVILGDQIEINLVRSIMTDANPWLFVTRPISGVLLALSVGSVIFALWQQRRQSKRVQQSAEGDADF